MEIAAVIPAYNEEKRIAQVVDIVSKHNLITETIVVSDGSEDDTALVAKRAGARVIELEENIGKGGAMKVGIEHNSAEIILLLDADLIGLSEEHIYKLVNPIIIDEVDMTVGVFTEGRVATDLAQKITPFLSGQRGVKRQILQKISDLDVTRFGVEIALNKYAQENEVEVKEVILEDLTHVMKEEKFGVWKGFWARVRMYWDIIKTFFIKT